MSGYYVDMQVTRPSVDRISAFLSRKPDLELADLYSMVTLVTQADSDSDAGRRLADGRGRAVASPARR